MLSKSVLDKKVQMKRAIQENNWEMFESQWGSCQEKSKKIIAGELIQVCIHQQATVKLCIVAALIKANPRYVIDILQKSAASDLIARMKKNPGFIFMLGHKLEPILPNQEPDTMEVELPSMSETASHALLPSELISTIGVSMDVQNQLTGDKLIELLKHNHLIQLESIIQDVRDKKSVLINGEQILPILAEQLLSESLQGQWTIKNRNQVQIVYDDRDAVLQGHAIHSKQKIFILQNIFELIDPDLYSELFPENQESDRRNLETWYLKEVDKAKRFFSADQSEDSDSADDREYEVGENFHYQRLRKMREQHNKPNFWRRTRRSDTGGNGSLASKTAKMIGKTQKISSKEVRDLIDKTLKGGGVLKERATLPASPSLDSVKEKYISFYRGVNYLRDRWNAKARRSHYYTPETGKTQYCEAAWMTQRNLYQDDFSEDMATIETHLEKAAFCIREGMQAFEQTGPCIAYTVKPQQHPYLFNSFADYLQHTYSNGISQHLIIIANYLSEKNPWFVSKFLNAYNYAISTSDRPYHSLRYALGLKEYYHFPFEPNYDQIGGCNNVHAGKMLIFLFTVEEFTKASLVNRVTKLILQGRTPIDYNISSEVETTFIGKVDGKHVVYELPIRFPTFHKAYKKIYATKYGLDEPLYYFFQMAIRETPLLSEERKSIIELLKEWLCAYYEVLAISLAQDLAQEKGGQLVYLDNNDTITNEPPLRPFTPSHLKTQNQVHALQGARWMMGKSIAENQDLQIGEVYFPEIDLQDTITKFSEDDEMLGELGDKIKLSQEEEGNNIIIGTQAYQSKKRKAEELLMQHRNTFFNSSVVHPDLPAKRLLGLKKQRILGLKSSSEDDYGIKMLP